MRRDIYEEEFPFLFLHSLFFLFRFLVHASIRLNIVRFSAKILKTNSKLKKNPLVCRARCEESIDT